MFSRSEWQQRLEAGWKKRSVVWLMGVRRVGKTQLTKTLPNVAYFDCELPRTRAAMSDPEAFLDSVAGQTIVLDEIHRLADPSELLKIAADHYPNVRIVATGSSTLAASKRFRDTLTGRKSEVWLTPMTRADISAFGKTDILHRMLRGGLPSFFLAEELPETEYQEWIDAYWARDIQELFHLERREAFRRLLELVLVQSGGIFDAARLARDCGVSHTTIGNYAAVLEATFVVHLVRPFAKRGRAEIVSAPKAYAFDTGFVCHQRGWRELRRDDFGILWEHLVLNELHAHFGRDPVRYWRTRNGREVDFVLDRRGGPPVAIECKWSASDFDSSNLRAFRSIYTHGQSLVATADTSPGRAYEKRVGDLRFTFVAIEDLINHCQ